MKSTYYISTNGNDRWSGKLDKPNSEGNDGPFRSFSRARDQVRSEIAKGLENDISVKVRGGYYHLEETLVLGLNDSAPSPFTVTYGAYQDEEPVLSGARKITGWNRVDQLPEGVPKAADGKLWSAPLSGRWARSLYQGSTRLRRSCEPGFEPTLELSRDQWSADRDAVSSREIRFPAGTMENRLDHWDIEAVIRPMWPWVVNIIPLTGIDVENGNAELEVEATYPVSRLQFGTEQERASCWIENSPQGLDRPNTWLHDTRNGVLYLWPDGPEPEDIFAPELPVLIRVDGGDGVVRGIVFDGLTFIHGEREVWSADDAGLQHDWDLFDKDNALVRFRNTENCTVSRCHFTATGGGAIRFDLHSRNNTVAHNLIEDIGGTGILLCGYGPGTKDVSKRNIVEDNHVHHCGRVFWHAPAIFLWQSGENLVAHNLIHDVPYNAVVISGVRPHDFRETDRRECARTIRRTETGEAVEWHEILPFLHGRNNIFEFNEIHHAMQRLADGNAVYISGCGEGNIIRSNYIHDMGEKTNAQAALRTDGWQRGTTFTENIIYDCACGIMRKNNNHVENNIIVNARDDLGSIAFRHFPEDEITHGSRVMRNICYQDAGPTSFYEVRDPNRSKTGEFTAPENCKCDFNLFYDRNSPDAGDSFISEMRNKGLESHSVAADPLLADPSSGAVTPKPGSPAYALGFKPIDMGAIGLTAEFPKKFAIGTER